MQFLGVDRKVSNYISEAAVLYEKLQELPRSHVQQFFVRGRGLPNYKTPMSTKWSVRPIFRPFKSSA